MLVKRYESYVVAKSKDSDSVIRFSILSDEFGGLLEFLDLFIDFYLFDSLEMHTVFSSESKEVISCPAENI